MKPTSDMSHEGGSQQAHDDNDTKGDKLKCKRCDEEADKKCCDHCEACFKKLLLAQSTMNLATGDTSLFMSEHSFADLFKLVLFPLFEEQGVVEFLKFQGMAMKEFSNKFNYDHMSIEMLTLVDRVKNYSFNKRSLQD